MANTKSAAKRARTSEKRRMYNRSIKSRVKTMITKFEQAVASGERESASARFVQAASALDKAVSKGVLHKNLAASRKSRMARKLAALQ